MRFHWYFPFARTEELDWARFTPRAGETLVLQVIDRPHAPASGEFGPVTVVRDLPDVDRDVSPAAWLPSRARTYVSRSRARKSRWKTDDFDLVHLHYLNRFTDTVAHMPHPLVLSVHDVVPHQMRLGRAELPLLRRLYSRGDAIIVHHRSLKERLQDEFSLDDDRLHVVPHQVFSAPFTAPPRPDLPPLVLFFGALRANKGLHVLLDAFKRVGVDGLRLAIAGRGDKDVEALAVQAAERDPSIAAEIGFVSLERKWELFRQASVVVLPYTSFASQSGVLHDAYAMGRPVVVTDVGALGRSVEEDGTGLVAVPSDPDDLAETLRAVLNPPTWDKLAGETTRVRQDRSPQRTGERVRAVYDTVTMG